MHCRQLPNFITIIDFHLWDMLKNICYFDEHRYKNSKQQVLNVLIQISISYQNLNYSGNNQTEVETKSDLLLTTAIYSIKIGRIRRRNSGRQAIIVYR